MNRNQLEPGKLIFSDQYGSRLPGRVFCNRGSKITSQYYKGVTIFCDSASRKISVHHQVSFTAEYTIMSKLNFKRDSMREIVPVESYSTDNGIYTSKGFTKEFHGKFQGISNSVLGGHHHNGVV